MADAPDLARAGLEAHCTACGAQVLDEARFCVRCGGPVGHTCTACRANVRAGDAFCSECGAPLQAPAPISGPSPARPSPTTAARAAPTPDVGTTDAGTWLALGGLVAALIGLFLDWVSAAGGGIGPLGRDHFFRLDSLLGTEWYLDLVAVIACVTVGGVAVVTRVVGRIERRRGALVVGGCGALLLAIALLQFELLAGLDDDLPGVFSPGIGLWLLTVGSSATVVGASISWIAARRST